MGVMVMANEDLEFNLSAEALNELTNGRIVFRVVKTGNFYGVALLNSANGRGVLFEQMTARKVSEFEATSDAIQLDGHSLPNMPIFSKLEKSLNAVKDEVVWSRHVNAEKMPKFFDMVLKLEEAQESNATLNTNLPSVISALDSYTLFEGKIAFGDFIFLSKTCNDAIFNSAGLEHVNFNKRLINALIEDFGQRIVLHLNYLFNTFVFKQPPTKARALVAKSSYSVWGSW